MIHNVLSSLRTELGEHMDIQEIVIDDISKGGGDDTGISDKVVITLLNVEEEATMKNLTRMEKVLNPGNPSGYIQRLPSAYLNLYVMIAANKSTYAQSLIDISTVIETFKTKNVLTFTDAYNTTYSFKLGLNWLPFDQLSYAWGLLGGKVMPSAMYKVSILQIQRHEATPVNVEVIRSVDVEEIKDFKIELP